CSEFPYTRKCREKSGVPSSVNERRSRMPLITPRNQRSGGPDTLCNMAINLITLARDRDEWRRYRRPLEEVDDQGKGTTGDTGDSPSIRKAFTTVYDDCLFYFD
ncbi:hypothetical protein V3C99_017795, partial [Haemonchus contortus]